MGMPVCLEVESDNKIIHSYVYRTGPEGKLIGLIDLKDLHKGLREESAPRNCRSWKRIQPEMIPEAYVTSPVPKDLPQDLVEAFSQMRAGGSVFRSEKTAEEFLTNHPVTEFEAGRLKELSQSYGEQFAGKVYQAFISTKNVPTDCRELVGDCDYYLCREKQQACGVKGYYLAFGYQYCNKSLGGFQERVSENARGWLKNVATCLQQTLEDEVPTQTECKEVKNRAVDSHIQCYKSTNFCALKIEDKIKIIAMLSPELARPQMLQVGITIMANCLKGNQ